MHVMAEDDGGGRHRPWSQEGNAVLGIDDDVEGPQRSGAQEAARLLIDGQLAAHAHEPDPVDDLQMGRRAMRRADLGHRVAAVHEAPGDLVHVHLGTAAFRVGGVPPVQEGDAHPDTVTPRQS